MCSGKSSTMFQQATRACFAGSKVDIVVYSGSQRKKTTKNTLFSHNTPLQLPSPADSHLNIAEYTSIQSYLDSKPDAKYVGIDEGQFFTDLRPGVEYLMQKGVHVYISALNGDFRLRPWTSVSNLLPIVTHIHMLRAVCPLCKNNHTDANYNKLVKRTDVPADTPHIGDVDMYISTCWKHFHS